MCNSPTYQADIPHDETNPFSNKHSLPKIVRFLASIIFVPLFRLPRRCCQTHYPSLRIDRIYV